ncbi:sulfotransferase family protein [Tamilnaduibacter salinus]|uniref:Sulfotransferase family protein n=1 Tax=Tamilnaduibacter salinus TaxID=1484056 RepID=A0A2U1D1E4_9GAMM|nr:sulfotransferase family protein [Tamilnaduibacter salinus]
MKIYNKSTRYAFLHIGKTAGTAVRQSIASQFTPDAVCPYYFHRQIESMPDEELEKYGFISAHIGYDLAKSLSDNVFTVLRNPFDRVVSLYYYWRSVEGDRGGPVIAKESRNFEEFLEVKKAPVIVDIFNAQTWQLAHGHEGYTRKKLRGAYTEDQLLQKAKENLEQLSVVGVQDNLGLFLQRINQKFGWNVNEILESNRNKERPKIDDVPVRTKRKIYDLVYLDLELYFFAQKLADY